MIFRRGGSAERTMLPLRFSIYAQIEWKNAQKINFPLYTISISPWGAVRAHRT